MKRIMLYFIFICYVCIACFADDIFNVESSTDGCGEYTYTVSKGDTNYPFTLGVNKIYMDIKGVSNVISPTNWTPCWQGNEHLEGWVYKDGLKFLPEVPPDIAQVDTNSLWFTDDVPVTFRVMSKWTNSATRRIGHSTIWYPVIGVATFSALVPRVPRLSISNGIEGGMIFTVTDPYYTNCIIDGKKNLTNSNWNIVTNFAVNQSMTNISVSISASSNIFFRTRFE